MTFRLKIVGPIQEGCVVYSRQILGNTRSCFQYRMGTRISYTDVRITETLLHKTSQHLCTNISHVSSAGLVTVSDDI